MLKIKNNIGGSGGITSGQYVWSKQESEDSTTCEYVVANTTDAYPDGGWANEMYYKRQEIIFTLRNANDNHLYDAYIVTQGMKWEQFISIVSTWFYEDNGLIVTSYGGKSFVCNDQLCSKNVKTTDIIRPQNYYIDVSYGSN